MTISKKRFFALLNIIHGEFPERCAVRRPACRGVGGSRRSLRHWPCSATGLLLPGKAAPTAKRPVSMSRSGGQGGLAVSTPGQSVRSDSQECPSCLGPPRVGGTLRLQAQAECWRTLRPFCSELQRWTLAMRPEAQKGQCVARPSLEREEVGRPGAWQGLRGRAGPQVSLKLDTWESTLLISTW